MANPEKMAPEDQVGISTGKLHARGKTVVLYGTR